MAKINSKVNSYKVNVAVRAYDIFFLPFSFAVNKSSDYYLNTAALNEPSTFPALLCDLDYFSLKRNNGTRPAYQSDY